ncbi:sigma-70 family RNA polymerase sigma factor [Bacteroides fragilis]|uniref:sigma-70 family RNA polymerase sigma factor n=1 Tax=Bacteroides fragilis TaxID=817 RepID=UPI00202FEE92|nr:sigma-70 family RNA polymerase sigma factor [Bacteroides fragilis]MCM0239364.1 sigma-70 family RNA polymerase sigma factor [Bacteroides fragilis]
MRQTETTISAFELEKWIDGYSEKLLDRACYLLSDKEDAKDVVQEVFLSAYKSRESFQGKSSPLTWLTSILHHKIADIYKKRYNGNPQPFSFETFFDKHGEWIEPDVADPWEEDEFAVSTLLDNNSFCDILNQCLGRLPQQWLMVVNKCYLQEQKAVEICRELNLTTANYWKLLQRSRLQLRKCIDVHWFKI